MKFSTRRRICRVIFYVACVIPTCLVGATAIVLQTPAYHTAQIAAWQARLAAQLGLEVQVSDVTTGSNSRSVVHDIEMRDPESHEWLARVRSAEIIKTKRGWAILLGQPQISSRGVGRLAAILHEHVLLRTDGQEVPVQLAASSIELQSPDNSESVLDVRCAVESRQEGAELCVEFRAGTMPADQRVRMRFVRNRQLNPAATGWELHTPATGLPCSVALAWLPGLGALGDDCVFQGSVWCEQHPAGWKAELAGVFRDVDLEQLVTRQFPHKLSGMAVLTLDHLQVDQGQISEVIGRLQCAGGVVSQSLLDAAAQSWRLQQHPRAGGAPLLRYENLALDFSLSSAGLTLATPEAAGAAVLTDRQGALLSLHDSQPRSPLSLVQLLVPQADLQVPATRETAALFKALPLPEVSTPPAPTARADYSPLRLHLR